MIFASFSHVISVSLDVVCLRLSAYSFVADSVFILYQRILSKCLYCFFRYFSRISAYLAIIYSSLLTRYSAISRALCFGLAPINKVFIKDFPHVTV